MEGEAGLFIPQAEFSWAYKNFLKHIIQKTLKTNGIPGGSRNLFHATVNKEKIPYTIVIPPPNITGILTMGACAEQYIARYICSVETYEWIWSVLDSRDGPCRHCDTKRSRKISRERRKTSSRYRPGKIYRARLAVARKKYGSTIIRQLAELLVLSCDWERERFTMDEGLSNAVKEVFIRLSWGLIYRRKYNRELVPGQHQTASSVTDEVDQLPAIKREISYYIKLSIVGSSEQAIIATTRPETMLGDTALCVHPKDERYQHLIGKTANFTIGRT